MRKFSVTLLIFYLFFYSIHAYFQLTIFFLFGHININQLFTFYN